MRRTGFGLPALALTDRDGVYGVVRAHVKAREVGLKLIIGSEVIGRRWLDDCSVGPGSRRLRQSLPADYQRAAALGERGERGRLG